MHLIHILQTGELKLYNLLFFRFRERIRGCSNYHTKIDDPFTFMKPVWKDHIPRGPNRGEIHSGHVPKSTTICPKQQSHPRKRGIKANWGMNNVCEAKLNYINVIYLIDWWCGGEVQFPLPRSHFIAPHSVIYNLYISRKYRTFFSPLLSHSLVRAVVSCCCFEGPCYIYHMQINLTENSIVMVPFIFTWSLTKLHLYHLGTSGRFLLSHMVVISNPWN